jgi:hypothetical protein
MRYVRQVVLAEDIRQAVWGGVHLVARFPLGRPEISSPGDKRQPKENRDGSCENDCCQHFSSRLMTIGAQPSRLLA